MDLESRNLKQKISYRLFRIIRGIVDFVYPEIRVEGAENLPDGPYIIIGNHAQMNGPIIGELYIPGKNRCWCAGEMMDIKEVPAYAYKDFWSLKPRYIRWFYKMLSYIIAPLSSCIFNNAATIPVYRDTRIMSTFRKSLDALEQGCSITIFPEMAQAHNNIVNEFQEGFVDLARLYYKRHKRALPFVPLYIAPKLRKIYFGKAIYFDPQAPIAEERKKICNELMGSITEIAISLPEHTVVPYLNISKKQYPKNTPSEVKAQHEKTSC